MPPAGCRNSPPCHRAARCRRRIRLRGSSALVPVRPSSPRSTCSSVQCGSIRRSWGSPLTVRVERMRVMCRASPMRSTQSCKRAWNEGLDQTGGDSATEARTSLIGGSPARRGGRPRETAQGRAAGPGSRARPRSPASPSRDGAERKAAPRRKSARVKGEPGGHADDGDLHGLAAAGLEERGGAVRPEVARMRCRR